jgi:flagellar protein FliO/FliZ
MRCLKCIVLSLPFAFVMPLHAAEAGMALTGLKTVFALLLVIALMFGLAWALKRYGPIARAKKSFGLTVIGQVALDAKANLALIRIGRSILLLGVTQTSINLLKDLDEGDFEKSLSEIAPRRGTHQ